MATEQDRTGQTPTPGAGASPINAVDTVIEALESQLDKNIRLDITKTLEALRASPQFQVLSPDQQIRILNNRRMALVFAASSPKQIGEALLKVQTQQPELASKFRDSINGAVRDLLKDASTRGLNLEEKNATEAFSRWYNHRDGLIGKYIDSATSVQQTVVGFAGLLAGLGAIISMFPGHESMGDTLLNKALDLQKNMSAQIAAQMGTINTMQTDNMPNTALLSGIRATNVSLRSSVTADQGPLNDLFGEIPRRFSPHEINQVATQYLKRQAQISGESFEGDFLSGRLQGSGSGLAAGGSGRTVSGRNSEGKFVLGPYDDKTFNGLVTAMGRPSPYDAEIQNAATKFGLDPRELKLRMLAESSGQAFKKDGKTPLTSPEGAIGLMQFMPRTAASFGIDPTDPKQSIHGAAQLIAEALHRHGGRTDLLDSEYYGGDNRASWGPNTRQYVENLKRVRKAVMGHEVITYDTKQIKLAKAADTVKVADAPATPDADKVVAGIQSGVNKGAQFIEKAVKGKPVEVEPAFREAAARTPAPKATDMRAAKARNDQGLNEGNTEGQQNKQTERRADVDKRHHPALTLDRV